MNLQSFCLLNISYFIEKFQVDTNKKKLIFIDIFSLIISHFTKE
jgi:hypothetical protein